MRAYRDVAEGLTEAAQNDRMATDAAFRDLVLNELSPVIVTKLTKNVTTKKSEVSAGPISLQLPTRYFLSQAWPRRVKFYLVAKPSMVCANSVFQHLTLSFVLVRDARRGGDAGVHNSSCERARQGQVQRTIAGDVQYHLLQPQERLPSKLLPDESGGYERLPPWLTARR